MEKIRLIILVLVGMVATSVAQVQTLRKPSGPSTTESIPVFSGTDGETVKGSAVKADENGKLYDLSIIESDAGELITFSDGIEIDVRANAESQIKLWGGDTGGFPSIWILPEEDNGNYRPTLRFNGNQWPGSYGGTGQVLTQIAPNILGWTSVSGGTGGGEVGLDLENIFTVENTFQDNVIMGSASGLGSIEGTNSELITFTGGIDFTVATGGTEGDHFRFYDNLGTVALDIAREDDFDVIGPRNIFKIYGNNWPYTSVGGAGQVLVQGSPTADGPQMEWVDFPTADGNVRTDEVNTFTETQIFDASGPDLTAEHIDGLLSGIHGQSGEQINFTSGGGINYATKSSSGEDKYHIFQGNAGSTHLKMGYDSGDGVDEFQIRNNMWPTTSGGTGVIGQVLTQGGVGVDGITPQMYWANPPTAPDNTLTKDPGAVSLGSMVMFDGTDGRATQEAVGLTWDVVARIMTMDFLDPATRLTFKSLSGGEWGDRSQINSSGNLLISGTGMTYLVGTGGVDIDALLWDLNLNAELGDVVTTAPQGNIIMQGLTYPSADGTVGQVLQTDGVGTLSWGDAGTGGDVYTDQSNTFEQPNEFNSSVDFWGSVSAESSFYFGSGFVMEDGGYIKPASGNSSSIRFAPDESGTIEVDLAVAEANFFIRDSNNDIALLTGAGAGGSQFSIYGNAFPTVEGAVGEVLTQSASGVVSWEPATGGSGGEPTPTALVSPLVEDSWYYDDTYSSSTLALPGSPTEGSKIQINVTNEAEATMTFSGGSLARVGESDFATAVTLPAGNNSLVIRRSGNTWRLVDSGWEQSGGASDFLSLTDTPSDYSGTSGYYLTSSGTGVAFTAPTTKHPVTFPLTFDSIAGGLSFVADNVPADFVVTSVKVLHFGTVVTPSVDVQVSHGTSLASMSDLFATAPTCNTINTGDTNSPDQNTAVAAGSWLKIDLTNVTGTTDRLVVVVIGTYNDQGIALNTAFDSSGLAMVDSSGNYLNTTQ